MTGLLRMVTSVADQFRDRDWAPRVGRILVVVGAVVAGAVCFAPWASLAFGYPGNMTLSGQAGGARAYLLIIAVATVAAGLIPAVPNRRKALLFGGYGAFAVVVYNLIAMARDGNNFSVLAWGIWVALVASLAMAAGAVLLPDDDEPGRWKLPAVVELLVISAAMGVALYVVVYGLDVNESSRFISYGIMVGFVAAMAHRVGLFGAVTEMAERHRHVTVVAALVAAAAFPLTQNGNAYWLRVFASVGVFAAAAIGLNIVVGLAGLLDLGYIAFFGVGAYVGALFADAGLTTVHVHLPFLVVVLLGACIAAMFGVIIGAPTLRLRGDYLAIVTLGFGEIFRIIANQWTGLTRGPNGISDIPNLAVGSFNLGKDHKIGGFDLPNFANYYYVELILLFFVILAFTRLNSSRIGRAWVAIREDELAAEAMGVDTVRLKLLAFAIGAFLAGAAGTVNAHVGQQVSPDSYDFLESIFLLAAVVLGGMGTIPGALLGSTLLKVLPEKLRFFQEKRLLIFGIALVLMMRFRPEGIAASSRRQRELHSEDGNEGAMGAVPGSPVAAGGGS